MATNLITFYTGQHMEEASDDQLLGDCPFCGKEQHFYFNKNTTQWDCKVCKREGNNYTFLLAFHQKICTYTNYDTLSQERGLPEVVFRMNEIKWNPLLEQYVLPTYNRDGSMNNLYKTAFVVNEETGKTKRRWFAGPGLSTTLFNWPVLNKDELWVVEGQWDKLAAETIIGAARPIECMGLPGSNFSNSWANTLAGKKVVLFGHNDEAGDKLVEVVLKRINTMAVKPKEVSRINWPEGLPKGYDLNDLFRDKGLGCFDFIKDNTISCECETEVQFSSTIHANTNCDSYDKLLVSCADAYYFTPDMELLLLLMLTSLYSLKIDGEQLWLRVIGPPGSSKTTLAKIVGSSEQTVLRSTFTGLLSGWKDDEEADASLIPLIAGKALIVKDADALLRQPNITQILSELRDFYDKDTAATYRNRVSFDYKNIRSVFMLCGTHALRGMDNAALGDRFLDFELAVTEEDREHISDKVFDRTYAMALGQPSPENGVWEHAKGFIDNWLLNRDGGARLGEREKHYIKQYAQLIAYMRAKVERDKTGTLLYQPHAEVPSRLTGQFVKLYSCAPRIYNLDYPNNAVHRVVRRAVMNGINTENLRYKVCKTLMLMPNITVHEIVKHLAVEHRLVERELEDMDDLNMLTVKRRKLDSALSVCIFSLTEKIASQIALLEDSENGQI